MQITAPALTLELNFNQVKDPRQTLLLLYHPSADTLSTPLTFIYIHIPILTIGVERVRDKAAREVP